MFGNINLIIKTMFLFETPIKEKKVRNGIYAYMYRNGVIQIGKEKYFFYPMNEAIKKWRQDNPINYKPNK